MSQRVVVLGAGYAGTTAVQRLERELDDADVVWVSETDYHLVLHEAHRAVRDPSVRGDVTVPVDAVAGRDTEFVQGEVAAVDTEERTVELADDDAVDYDYLLVALGSQTAYYGIPGLAEQAHTLKSLDDAVGIHDAVVDAAADATADDPARVVVGGAGLSGVQLAGEVTELRDAEGYDVEVTLVEALEEVMPGQHDALQRTVRRKLEHHGVEILTDDPIVEAGEDAIEFDERDPLTYDVFAWTGGITGQDALDGAGLDADHNRVETEATFETSDDRVFAVGDSALVAQDDDEVAPPTAQAAWDAAEVAADNVARRIEGRQPRTWTYRDKGTVVSVGDEAVAHDVMYLPLGTFGGLPAELLKKAIAARWLAGITSPGRALSAWGSL
jgi:NADH dehydrogenase